MKTPTSPTAPTLLLILSAYAGVPAAAQPVIEGVEPSKGRAESATRITVRGSGFEPASTAALVPGGPYLVGVSASWVVPSSIVVANGLAYVKGYYTICSREGRCDSWETCLVFDVSDPRNLPPYPGGSALATDCGPPAVPARVDRGVLFDVVRANVVSDHQIVAIDPADPDRLVGAAPLDVTPFDPYGPGQLFWFPFDAHCVLTVQAGVAYVACGGMPGGYDGGGYTQGTLITIDVSDPFSPGMPRFAPVERATALAAEDTLLYVGSLDGDLEILDVSNPIAPVPLGSVSVGGPIGDIAVAEHRVYAVADDYHQPSPLRIIDVTDPRAPSSIGELDVGGATRVAASGSLVLVTSGNELRIVDATEGTAPTIVGGLPRSLTGNVKDVDVAGRIAVLSTCSPWNDCSIQALHLVDISSPEQPVIVGSAVTNYYDKYRHRISVSGERAFALRSGGNQLVIDAFDIGDPSHPVHLGASVEVLDNAGLSKNLTVLEDRAYTSVPGQGVKVFTIDDVGVPSPVGYLRGVGVAGNTGFGLDVVGGHLYAGDVGPLRIVRLQPGLEDVEFASDTAIKATVPMGLEPGPYDALVTNADGSQIVRHNAFRVCENRAFDARLVPVGLPDPLPSTAGTPIPVVPDPRASLRWRLFLEGDAALFEPPSHEASLVLPALPATLTTRFVPGDGSGRMTIKLDLAPVLGLGEVVLTGDNRTAVEALWDEVKTKASIALPRRDNQHYGDLVLEVHSVSKSRYPVLYRYEFVDGRLDAARASGPGVDLVIEASATDEHRCDFKDNVSVVETLGAECAEVKAAHPSMALACSP